ncbi:tRNA (adenosine(37)-N6)-threonylcarbamoyltransferase complex dimerization subunit type 1 TsaB [Gloeomargarita sp.]
MTLGLALHTAGATVGLAMGRVGEPLRTATYTWGQDTSRYFHQQLAHFLSPYRWSDVAFLAVTRGPGSFTALRLGLVTARVLAQELHLPLFALSTLGVASWLWSEPVAVSWPAGLDWLYGGIYQQGHALWADQVFTPSAWQELLATWPTPLRLVGDIHTQAPAEPLLRWAMHLWQAGERPHWSAAVPFYGRAPV